MEWGKKNWMEWTKGKLNQVGKWEMKRRGLEWREIEQSKGEGNRTEWRGGK